mmetsp:Transcript_19720/g.29265  ORF Transcript_19720/g.29265 Transcript_19720/m.29265 type:complete len:329 (-) Transcript_19720:126-1112(-)
MTKDSNTADKAESVGSQSLQDNSYDDESKDRSSETAGVVRGVSKSVGKSIGRYVMKGPIGKLPKSGTVPKGGILRQRVPIRQVARISDRVSTSWDWWSSAVDSTGDKGTGKQSFNVARALAFGTNLLKNTILGMAVFESYGYVVSKTAPLPTEQASNVVVRRLVDEENSEAFLDEPDEYARATLPAHFGAGFLAGSIHGIGSTFSERHVNLARFGAINTVHHSLAHSLLFGSYEAIKRIIISQEHFIDEDTEYYGVGYLSAFGFAGGIAGQVQHVASFYSEQWLGLSNSTLRLSFRSAAAPSLWSTLLAFPPSAIGFIAFEYGKKFTS